MRISIGWGKVLGLISVGFIVYGSYLLVYETLAF